MLLEALVHAASGGRDGSLSAGMGLDAAPLAARHGGDSLDRLVVLFHASRRLAAQTAQNGRGRFRRVVAGSWRRLLRDEQIHARPGDPPGPFDLAQMAVVLDLDFRLQPALLGLLRPVAIFFDRPGRHAARALASGADWNCGAGAWPDRL